MELELSRQELQIILSLTADNSHKSEFHDSLWRKVSKEFVREYGKIQRNEMVKSTEGSK